MNPLASGAARIEALVFARVMGLPERVQRRLAGPPIVKDGQTLAVEAQLMLRLMAMTRKPAETLPIDEGRHEIVHSSRIAGGSLPIGSVRDLQVGDLGARLYTPSIAVTPSPMLVFFHGGGWIYGDLDSHDAPCRLLAEKAGVRVLAIDYRLGPEDPFPAAYDDALAAYEWVLENAESLGANTARLAVGGDSAGGNLAAVLAIEAARRDWPLAFQLLVYPATDAARETRSFEMFGKGFFLTQDFMRLANRGYLADGVDPRDPRVSPLYADLPEGLAPAYLCTAGFDPLRDEGEAYARKLADAGVTVELKRFPDLIHGFFNIVGVGRRNREAVAEVAAKLRAGVRASG